MPDNDEALELRTVAVPAAVTVVRHAAIGFAEGCGAPAGLQHAIGLAVSEATTNVVVHAYVDRAHPGPVELRARRTADAIVVTIVDEGHGMQPRPDRTGIGIGLSTIARLADDLTLGRGAGGRGARLEMRFALAEAAAVAGVAQIAPAEEGGRPSVVRADLDQQAAGPTPG
ncbi:MAG: ATP-binding protein [Solirubrobacterales bacterium]|nr:ATP-binding protein [Solirubrobacterales bacterium]